MASVLIANTMVGPRLNVKNAIQKTVLNILWQRRTDMLDEFNKYKFIKKSKSELVADEIVQNISRKLWNDQGYNEIYRLGAIMVLKAMIESLRHSDAYTKKDLLMFLASQKNYNDTSDDIKNLIDSILEEFDYETN
jgi:hypothetical protein